MFRSKGLLFLVALVMVCAVLFAIGGGMLAARTLAAIDPASIASVVQNLTGSSPVSAAPSGALSATSATLTVQPQPTLQPVVINLPAGGDVENQIFEAIYQKVNPSVVEITTLGSAQGLPSSQNVPQGEGSGFVWDKQGDIVTNDHVVEGANQLQVTFADGVTVNAKVVGADPNADLAVIRVDPSLVNLVPVEQGNISQVLVGERVAAIGNPFGLSGTMTQGIVSAMGRSIPALTNFSIPEAIQTDAAINPGNSGGPLLNEQGQVIGINDQIQTSNGSSSGVGFAIPINIIQRVVPSLIKTGQYQHPYLGIEGGTFSPEWAQALSLPANVKGAYVLGLVSGGPAEQAGMRAGNQDTNILLSVSNLGQPVYLQSGGDLITAIDGHQITKMDDLLIYLEDNTSPGQTVQMTVLRARGQQQTLSVTLGQRPNQVSQSLP